VSTVTTGGDARNDESLIGSIHPSLNVVALIGRRMDPTSVISAFIGADVGMMQLAVAGDLARMDAGDPYSNNSSSIAQLTGAADQSANTLANVAAGIGTNLDISC
jgi:hypothetical protein